MVAGMEITKGTRGVGRCPTPRQGARLPAPRGRAGGLPVRTREW